MLRTINEKLSASGTNERQNLVRLVRAFIVMFVGCGLFVAYIGFTSHIRNQKIQAIKQWCKEQGYELGHSAKSWYCLEPGTSKRVYHPDFR